MHDPARLALALVPLLAAGPAPPAAAQVPVGVGMPCGDRAELARQLGAAYAEAPVSLGLQNSGDLLEVFASSRTGSWTIVSTAPDGEACVVAAGERWESVGPAARGPAI